MTEQTKAERIGLERLYCAIYHKTPSRFFYQKMPSRFFKFKPCRKCDARIKEIEAENDR
jgi:hypothetical protein